MNASNRPSGRVESADHLPASLRPGDNGSLSPHQSFARGRSRTTAAYVRELAELLSSRDIAVLRDLARVRCLSGQQLERLHFHSLGATNRDRARRRVLNRLIELSLVTSLARRVGGAPWSRSTNGARARRTTDGQRTPIGQERWISASSSKKPRTGGCQWSGPADDCLGKRKTPACLLGSEVRTLTTWWAQLVSNQ